MARTATPNFSLQDAMQYVLSTKGYDGLRTFLNQLPTQQIESLLAASEQIDGHCHTHPRHATMPMHDSYSSTSGCPSLSDLISRASIARNLRSLLPSAPQPQVTNYDTYNRQPFMFTSDSPAAPPAHIHQLATSYSKPHEVQRSSFNDTAHANRLAIQSDLTFLDPIHNFLRTSCIEVFVSSQNDMTAPGRGARPSVIGQVGLRCLFCKGMPRNGLAKQASCFPSKRETIFESVRNYQRTHFGSCPYIPDDVKAKYETMVNQSSPLKKPQKVLRAYYAEAASELGLVDSHCGLVFGAEPKESSTPSQNLQAIMNLAKSPEKFALLMNARCGKDEAIKMRKFEHVASERTRQVIVNARKTPTQFVKPQDFPTISDADFLLFHQVAPCRPSTVRLEQRRLTANKFYSLSGLCCKHCSNSQHPRDSTSGTTAQNNHHRGTYFPANQTSLSDSSFSQTLHNHLASCPNVPQEIKDALVELKQLAVQHGITTKRGSKKTFFEKIWERMNDERLRSL